MKTTETWIECVSDFCGNYKQPGAWVDLFMGENGKKFLRLGGGWTFYGEHAPEEIGEDDPHFHPFLKACEDGSDFGYAKENWNKPV